MIMTSTRDHGHGSSRNHPWVFLPENFIKNFLAFQRKRRKLGPRNGRIFPSRLHPSNSLRIPDGLESNCQVLQTQQKATIGLIWIVRWETCVQQPILRVHVCLVALGTGIWLCREIMIEIFGVRCPIAACGCMREIYDADVDLSALAATA
jgi:hypothetical protein